MCIKINEGEHIIEIKIKKCNEPIYAFLCSYFANKIGVALVSIHDGKQIYYFGLMRDFSEKIKSLCDNKTTEVDILFYKEMWFKLISMRK